MKYVKENITGRASISGDMLPSMEYSHVWTVYAMKSLALLCMTGTEQRGASGLTLQYCNKELCYACCTEMWHETGLQVSL